MLLLTNVTEEDSGEYTCQVSNYIGQVSQSGWLTVLPGKTKNETSIPRRPFPPCWCFGLFFCRPGEPGIFAEPLWCGLVYYFPYYFLVDLSWCHPANQTWKQACGLSLPLPSCSVSVTCFPCLFFPFLYHFSLVSRSNLSFPKGSGLFSMFLHLCLHGPLRIWWVHLCWVQRFSTFISIYVYGVFSPAVSV